MGNNGKIIREEELLKQKSKAEIDFENSIKKLEKKNGI